MIKVTGDRNLMEELAARADVARVDANPTVHNPLPGSPRDGFDAPTHRRGVERSDGEGP